MVVVMHVNSDDVYHDLTNQDVDNKYGKQCQQEPIHSYQILNGLFGKKDLLLIDDETI